MSNQPQPDRNPADRSNAWDVTYNRREGLFRELFGAFPAQVLKCLDLMVLWPGGCLVEFQSPKLNGLRVTSTFGLTNSDLPTDIKIARIDHSHDQVSGKSTTSTLLTNSFEPLPGVPGRSGYGYEIVALSRTPAEEGRPSFEAQVLQYLSGHQLASQRFNLLDEINDLGGLTYETVSKDGCTGKQYLLARYWGVISEAAPLPYGSMALVCLMEITSSELAYSRKHGPGALVQLMKDKEVLPINDPERQSVV